MRRLFRWAYNLAALVSAALCVVVIALMIRSYCGRSDFIYWATWGTPGAQPPVRIWTLGTPDGRVLLARTRFRRAEGPVLSGLRRDYWPPGVRVRSIGSAPSQGSSLRSPGKLIGSSHNWFNGGYGSLDDDSYWLPCWLVALATAVLPGISAVRLARRRHRRETFHCVGCGYDLRATPDRCPECGRVPGMKGATA